MPKMKTVKGVKGRFRLTRTGKVIAFRAGRRHLLAGKRGKLKRHLRRSRAVAKVDVGKIRPLIQ